MERGALRKVQNLIPIGRVANVEEMKVAVYLSPLARNYMVYPTIVIDGGLFL